MKPCQRCNGYDSGPVTCWSCERRNIRELEGEIEDLQAVEADYREYVARLTAQIEQLGAVAVLPDDYERNAAPRAPR